MSRPRCEVSLRLLGPDSTNCNLYDFQLVCDIDSLIALHFAQMLKMRVRLPVSDLLPSTLLAWKFSTYHVHGKPANGCSLPVNLFFHWLDRLTD
jgi:hypothetical protein